LNKYKLIVLVTLVTLISFFAGCAGRGKKLFIFAPIEIAEHKTTVNIVNFPEIIEFSFCSSSFDPDIAELTETVEDRVDKIPFKAFRAIPETLGVLIFIEDYSGSMLDRADDADRLISKTANEFPSLQLGIVRIGKKAIWALRPTLGKEFINLELSKLPKPPPNGTSLARGIFTALDSLPGQIGALVIISDASADHGFRLEDALHTANLREIPIVVVQLQGERNEVLDTIVNRVDGFYLHSSDPYDLNEVLSGGWKVAYTPSVTDTNGAEHNIVLRWGSKKKIGKYTAPGTPKPKPVVIEEKISKPMIEPIVIEGIRVPFMIENNARLLKQAKTLLDSFIDALPKSEFPLMIKIEGYTCDIGNAAYNLDLSIRRAKIVANYIRRNSKITLNFEIVGHGENDPLVLNNSKQNRQINRRVEIRLIYKVELSEQKP